VLQISSFQLFLMKTEQLNFEIVTRVSYGTKFRQLNMWTNTLNLFMRLQVLWSKCSNSSIHSFHETKGIERIASKTSSIMAIKARSCFIIIIIIWKANRIKFELESSIWFQKENKNLKRFRRDPKMNVSHANTN
jgi:hypothetical protein